MRINKLGLSFPLIFTACLAAADGTGAFTIYMAGKLIASESYSIQKSDGKIELSGSGKADLGPIKIDIQKFDVVSDDKFQPISAEADALMGKMKMEDAVSFGDGKAKNRINTGQGPQAKEDDVHADTLVVNSNLPLFAWSLLAMRVKLDSTDPQSFHAYILGQTEVPVTVVSKGRDTVEFADKKVELNRFAMSFPPGATAQPLDVDIWLDDSRKIIKIAVPAQNVEAYQQGFERKAPPPAPAAAPKP